MYTIETRKTLQALERFACVYATFEEAWANLENENSEVDPLHAEACMAQPGPLPGRSEGGRESLDAIFRISAPSGLLLIQRVMAWRLRDEDHRFEAEAGRCP